MARQRNRPIAALQLPAASRVCRFFVDPAPQGDALTLRGETAHRITRVLRLGDGAPLELFDGSGRVWEARIVALAKDGVRLSVGDARQGRIEPPTALLAALIRPQRFEWLIEKATELGATLIQPIICAHGAVRPDEIGAARLERWRRIAAEAAEQSGRPTVPELDQPQPLSAALKRAAGGLFIATEPAHGRAPTLGGTLGAVGSAPVTIIIGPEGGLTPDEVAQAVAAGATPVTLGPTVLRAETAAMAALAILADSRGRNGVHHGGTEGAQGMHRALS